jgi:hypothetical protein
METFDFFYERSVRSYHSTLLKIIKDRRFLLFIIRSKNNPSNGVFLEKVIFTLIKNNIFYISRI